jgi:hypothetical protein
MLWNIATAYASTDVRWGTCRIQLTQQKGSIEDTNSWAWEGLSRTEHVSKMSAHRNSHKMEEMREHISSNFRGSEKSF